jgi:hypothetical protein
MPELHLHLPLTFTTFSNYFYIIFLVKKEGDITEGTEASTVGARSTLAPGSSRCKREPGKAARECNKSPSELIKVWYLGAGDEWLALLADPLTATVAPDGQICPSTEDFNFSKKPCCQLR